MVKVEVRKTAKIEWFHIFVNNTLMCERPNHRYANEKAKAFAQRLAADGHDVSLKLYAPTQFNNKAA